MRAIGFFVSDGFQMLDLAGPAGAFEAANRELGSPSYRIDVLAAGAGDVMNSLGIATAAASLDDSVLDTLVVIGGWIDPRLPAYTLRRIVDASNRCRRVASVCTGAFALASAGLLDGVGRRRIGDSQLAFSESIPPSGSKPIASSAGTATYGLRRA
jgi:transcriptional regulator GlxA family with amidase domain